jgi:hypothetical protein
VSGENFPAYCSEPASVREEREEEVREEEKEIRNIILLFLTMRGIVTGNDV